MGTAVKSKPISVHEALGTPAVAAILGVHPRTLKRRATAAPKSAFQAQRERKLDEIWSELLTLYKPDNAVLWLKSPKDIYSGRTPLEVAGEDGGLDRVLEAVGRLSWGIPS